jgi:hypothetical protein
VCLSIPCLLSSLAFINTLELVQDWNKPKSHFLLPLYVVSTRGYAVVQLARSLMRVHH